MPVVNTQQYDAIIIGAGISGLVCGGYLAKAGMKVVVVEQHDKPGGYFTSFKRRGFLFDAAAHSFGNYRAGGHVRKILTELGVDEIVTINRYDPSDVIMSPDFTITLWNDMQRTVDELAKSFPKEKDNIARFFNFLTTADQVEFVRLKDKTFGHLLRSFFEDTRLVNALALPVFGNGGLPPSRIHAFSGAKIYSEFLIDGGYYVEGGIQNLPNALARIIRQNNGELRCRRLVKSILSEGRSVTGVELENGETLLSSNVIAACDMTQTYTALLRETRDDEEKTARISTMIPSLSTFILYIGIDRSFEGLTRPGTNIWHLTDYDLDQTYSRIMHCDFDRSCAFMFRVSPDLRTILAFMTAPFASVQYWKENKKKTEEDFLRKIEKAIPELKRHIVYHDGATPATLQRYTLNRQGAAFGWAKMPSQTADIMASKRSPLQGLYFAGHWTSIGFGMPGACYSGHDTARRILRTRKNQ